MSPPGCQKMLAKPCNQNAEESFPVHSLKSQAQKPPNPLLIQDKTILQPSTALHELQSECGESVRLLELLAHVSSHKLHMATCYSPMVFWRYYTPSSVRYKHLDSVLGQRLS